MPKVSVIVPVYNTEKYLVECLESLVNQTLNDMEIIIINDGSSDNSKNIILKYAEKYKNIIVINQENQGLYNSRKNGLKIATGEYIGWCDSDDFVEKTMFEKLYQAAILNHSNLSYCDYYFYPNKIKTKEKWLRKYSGNLDVQFIERNSQPWNKLVSRNLLEQLNIANLFPTCFDEIYIKVMLNSNNPIMVEEQLYFYRVGQNSMSSSYKNVQHYMNFIDASSKLKNEMTKNWDKITPYWVEYFEYREIYYMFQTLVVCANSRDFETYKTVLYKLKSTFPNYQKNLHISNILKYNFSFLKAVAIKEIIPRNYLISVILCKIFFR